MRLEHLLFREEANEFGGVFMLFLFLDAFVKKSFLTKVSVGGMNSPVAQLVRALH